MSTLVLCDDHWHPARTPRAGLVPLEAQGESFDWIEHASAWSAQRMAACRAVVFTKSNEASANDRQPWMDAAVQRAFVDYVRRGNGLLVIHSGLAGYDACPAWRALIGGVFVQHPPQCLVTVEPQAGHPLAAGSAPFTLVDEHYFVQLDDSAATVFVHATSEHGTQPAGWTRTEGAGRVCVLAPGHNLEVWLDPMYQALIRNALHWCQGKN